MHFGAAMFFTDYSMTPAEFGQALEQRGFEFGLGTRALAHSHLPPLSVVGWRGTAEAGTMMSWTRSSRSPWPAPQPPR